MTEIKNEESEIKTEDSTTEEEMVTEETPAVDDAPKEEMPAAAAAEQPPPETPVEEDQPIENMEAENLTTTTRKNSTEISEAENSEIENSVTKNMETENTVTEDTVTEDAATENSPTEDTVSEILVKEETVVENLAKEDAVTENQEPENLQPPENAAPEDNCDNEVAAAVLNPLNEPEPSTEVEAKGKHRRYWTPKEEEKFYQIWGRENWRLTRHGKNTVFFAKWSDEMRERFNFDIKPEEVQCKVNQTRAKFRQVKKHLETDKNYVKWKKYDIVERILKNQYRSKDDEPVPIEALENNRDVSPTELMNSSNQPCSPNSMSNMSTIPEQGINLSQSASGDHQLTDEINMSNVSLSDHNLYNNNSQSGTSFSTELFGSDQLEIKQEIETDIKREGYINEFLPNDDGLTDGSDQMSMENQSQLHQQLTQPLPQHQQVPFSMLTENSNNLEQNQMQQHANPNPNSLLINNRLIQNHSIIATSNADGILNINANHTNNNTNTTMQPPKAVDKPATPRKRNRQPASAKSNQNESNAANNALVPIPADALETLYLEEVRKKNVLLVEQGEINRKRLRLEERKVKLMEDFFPKFMNLQQEIIQKLDNVSNSKTEAINIKMEE